MEHKTKATLPEKILVSLLIIANVSLASFIWFQSQAKQGRTPNKEIPSALLLADDSIQSRLFELAGKSNSGRAVMVLLTSASTSCSTGTVIDVLKSHAKTSENNLLVLLPSTFSQSDIDNFKVNLEVPYSVERAGETLSAHWLQLAAKYDVAGVVLLIDNGEISVLQNLSEVDRHLTNSD